MGARRDRELGPVMRQNRVGKEIDQPECLPGDGLELGVEGVEGLFRPWQGRPRCGQRISTVAIPALRIPSGRTVSQGIACYPARTMRGACTISRERSVHCGEAGG